MRVDIYWIRNINAGQLGIMARPRGGDWLEDEISSLCNSGVNIVLSLLTEEEVSELNLLEESFLCKVAGIEYISFPIIDRNIPSINRDTAEFVQNMLKEVYKGKNLVIHCRQGIGRSSLMAASILAMSGITVDKAFEYITIVRGCSVPDTEEQKEWVINFINEYYNK